MQLLQSKSSPFVRKVLVTLHETGQFDDVTHVTVATTALASDPRVTAANPIGKIPALLRSEAPTLFDSRVICRFLDARAKAGLYPEPRLWETLTLEALVDGLLDAAVLMVYETRLRPETLVMQDWIESQWAKVARALDALEARWISHLHGPFDMGHIAVGCALGYLDLRHDSRAWREGRESLAAWYAEFATRDSMVATRPD